MQVLPTSGHARHFYPYAFLQALRKGAGQPGIFALRANQRVGQVLQEYAADAALGGVAEYKAAVQGFVLDAREDFAAHSVLDVQARFGGLFDRYCPSARRVLPNRWGG